MDYDSDPLAQQQIDGSQLIGAQPASQSPGFWSKLGTGFANYIGNDTRFGQDINSMGRIFQNASGNPQSQLIGNPYSNNTPSNVRPPSRIDILNKYINNQKQQAKDAQQVAPPPPVAINLPQPPRR